MDFVTNVTDTCQALSWNKWHMLRRFATRRSMKYRDHYVWLLWCILANKVFVVIWLCIRRLNWVSELLLVHITPCQITDGGLMNRSITPKFVTPTGLSCIDNRWRSTTLKPKKLTSSTSNLKWCHVHFIRGSYTFCSTLICRVIGLSKNSTELFFYAKFDFKSTWNRDWTTSHHKHPVCQYPDGARRN